MQDRNFIICISQTSWEGVFQKTIVQLMTELAPRHRVLFVDYQYTLKDWIMGLLGRVQVPLLEAVRLKNPLNRKTLANGAQLYLWTPPVSLPVNWMPDRWHDRVMKWNANRMLRSLRKVIPLIDNQPPLVVNAFNPVWGLPMLGKLNEKATIYYCFDEITIESWIARHGGRCEKEYLPKVDAVVTTSVTLRSAKSQLQPRAFCVKNGANYDLFSQARELALTTDRSRPIVGYLGTADNRINLDLVEYCLQALPQVTFQFIGRITDEIVTQRLSKYPNLEFIKPVPPAELVPLMARLHVGIIPFNCSEHTYTIYPLKINEYLAAGIPVVSTRFSILDDFDEVVDFVNEPAAFVEALKKSLAGVSDERVEEFIETAASNSWVHRAEEFEDIMQQVFNAKLSGHVTPVGQD
ncbi:glycosyltransferase [Spirosoma sp.]|uniref:glycosyltransferase n=1 Tax=Spirosoma sp. TaxID=1899569 RepID=UPI00261FBFEB|nr:glycosyltransferase [Spirosoma sp.]MCX6217310.1 glycosyltransferase [Spirosoma sp.]